MANKDYSFRQILEIEACTNCQICANVCPAVTAAGDGELSAVYRIDGIRKILKSRSRLRRLFRANELSQEQWNQYSDTVFRCTLCGNCQEVCPVGINMRVFTKKLEKDCFDLFQWEAGMSLDVRPPLDTYQPGDPDDFIK